MLAYPTDLSPPALTRSQELGHQAQKLLQERSHRQELRRLAGPVEAHIQDLRSNDYLGLSRHPQVVRAAAQAVLNFGTGAGASPLVSTRHRLDEALAERLQPQLPPHWRMLLAGSGYAANATFFETLRLLASDLAIFMDHRSHASLIAGARASGLPTYFFPHRDYPALESKLERCSARHRIVVVEALHSMEGSFEPLDALADICQSHPGTMIFVDEAHSAGTFGSASWTLGPQSSTKLLPLLIGVMLGCGKTLGSAGGILCIPQPLRDLALQGARPLLYSTAPPPATLAAIEAALGVVAEQGEALSAVLQNQLHRFCFTLKKTDHIHVSLSSDDPSDRDGASQAEHQATPKSPHIRVNIWQHRASVTTKAQLPLLSPIITLEPTGFHARNKILMHMKDLLLQAGYAAAVIRWPTVPAGQERIRLSFCLAPGPGTHHAETSLGCAKWPEDLARQLADCARQVCMA